MTTEVKILVCDDDSDTLFLVGEDLKDDGYFNVELFTDIEKFKSSFTGPGQVAVLDHRLGGKDYGYDVMDAILKMQHFIRPLFIIISGNHDPNVYTEYTRRGIHGYIDKNKRHQFTRQLLEFTRSAVEAIQVQIDYYEKWLKQTLV